MALLREPELQRELAKKKARAQIFCFFGPEWFKTKEWAKRLLAVVPESYTHEEILGDEWDEDRFFAALTGRSLFSEGTLLWIRGADSLPTKAWDTIAAATENLAEEFILLLTAENLDGRRSAIQKLQKREHSAFVRMELCDEREFSQWARKLAEAKKRKLEAGVVEAIWDRVGASLFELDNALEKAALYEPNQTQITVAAIDSVVARVRPDLVFGFTDAIAAGDRKLALDLLERLLSQGEEPIAIVGLLIRQVRWALAMGALSAEGRSQEQVLKDLGIFPRAAKGLQATIKRRGYKKIAIDLERLCDADHALKSSREPANLLLSRLTLEITS